MKNGENTKNNNDNILFKKDFYLICIANLCTTRLYSSKISMSV